MYICDVCHAGGRCAAPVAIRFQRCKLVPTEQCSQAPTESGRSCADGTHEVFKIALMGCVGVFRGVNAREDAQSNNNPIEYS